MTKYIANSYHTLFMNDNRYIGGDIQIFDDNDYSKKDMFYGMLDYLNFGQEGDEENGLVNSEHIIAIPIYDNCSEIKWQYRFYDYEEGKYDSEYYINNYSPIGNESFGFINLRIL